MPYAQRTRPRTPQIDDSQHGEPEQMTFDQQRTELLTAEGYRVPRFWNRDVLTALDDCMTTIWAELRAQYPRQDTPT